MRGRISERVSGAVCAAIAVVLACVASAGSAWSGDTKSKDGQSLSSDRGARVALPFACRVEVGRVRLTPSRDRFYAIVGPREEQPVTACSDAAKPVCRTLVAHRFVLSCGGKRVSWADVAAAIGGRRTSQVWKAERRINVLVREGEVRQGSACGASSDGDAATTEPAPNKAELIPIAQRACDEAAPARVLKTHFVMPEGFAPLSLFGARLIDAAPASAHEARQDRMPMRRETGPTPSMAAAAAPDAVRDAGPRSVSDQSAAGASPPPRRRMSRALERMILSEPLPEITQEPRLDIATAPAAMAWSATVRREGDVAGAATLPGLSAEASATLGQGVLVWLVATGIIAMLGWLGWTQHAAALGRLEAGLRRSTSLQHFAGAVARLRGGALATVRPQAGPGYPIDVIESRLRHVAGVVERLGAAAPLRQVLDDEVRRVRGRLAASAEVAEDGSGGRRIGAAAYRVLLRDLDRIERIADSAGRSIGGASPVGSADARMPETSGDAYAVLGINGNVSDATLKKIADALRMSWHPDLAHDEPDRLNREERTKQINIAVELIEAERRASAPRAAATASAA